MPKQGMDDEDWSIVRSPSVELPSLPLPPRRPVVNLNFLGGQAAELDRPEWPTIPSFSTNNTVNAFPFRRLFAALSARLMDSPNSTHHTSGGLSSISTACPVHFRSGSIGGISSRHQSIFPPGSATDTIFMYRELDDSAGSRKYALTEDRKYGMI
jgi:hypothetical protein